MATKKKIEDIVEEQSETVVIPEFVAPAPMKVVVAREGDSYASLAEKHAPEGAVKHDYAIALFELNGGAVVRPGAQILVK